MIEEKSRKGQETLKPKLTLKYFNNRKAGSRAPRDCFLLPFPPLPSPSPPSPPPSCLVPCQLSLQIGLGSRIDVEVGLGTGDDSGQNGPQDLHRKNESGK